MTAQASLISLPQGSNSVNLIDEISAELLVNKSGNNQDQPQADQASNKQVLDEIEALQQAILEDVDFNFEQLEATAAGVNEDAPATINESNSFAAPALGEDSNHQVNYYSDSSAPSIINTDSAALSQTDSSPVSNSILTSSLNANANLSSESSPDSSNPENTGISQGNTTEDFKITLQGSINSDFQLSNTTLSTDFGSITFNEQGDWSYQLNNQDNLVQSLGAGDTLTDLIELTADNNETYQIEVTINGTNDNPIITGSKLQNIQALSVREQASNDPVETSGQLTIQDKDAGEARFIADSDIQGTYGSASINAQGDWHYTLNGNLSAIEGLTSGESLNDIFSATTADGSSQLIQITITGADDKPFLSGGNRLEIDLADSTQAEGALFINDPDFGQSAFQEQDIIESSFGYGTGSIDESGHWSYTLDTSHPAVSTLGNGSKLYDTFTVTTADGTEQAIIIPILGSDSPAFALGTSSEQPLIELSSLDHTLSPSSTLNQAISTNDSLDASMPFNENTTTLMASSLLEDSSEIGLDQLLEASASKSQANSGNATLTNDTSKTIMTFSSSESEILQQLTQTDQLDLS